MTEYSFEYKKIDDTLDQLVKIKANMAKYLYESLGMDLGKTENSIQYKNYLINYPMIFGMFGSDAGMMGGLDGDAGISSGMLNLICQWETGHSFGYTMTSKDLNGYNLGDAHGHKTFGYGLLMHPNNGQYMDSIKSSWTQQELEILFKTYIKKTVQNIDSWANKKGIVLNQNQKDAITSACYNFGMGFLNKNVGNMIAQNPNNPDIKNVWAHMSDSQAHKYGGLVKRRQTEANWYFGQYS